MYLSPKLEILIKDERSCLKVLNSMPQGQVPVWTLREIKTILDRIADQQGRPSVFYDSPVCRIDHCHAVMEEHRPSSVRPEEAERSLRIAELFAPFLRDYEERVPMSERVLWRTVALRISGNVKDSSTALAAFVPHSPLVQRFLIRRVCPLLKIEADLELKTLVSRALYEQYCRYSMDLAVLAGNLDGYKPQDRLLFSREENRDWAIACLGAGKEKEIGVLYFLLYGDEIDLSMYYRKLKEEEIGRLKRLICGMRRNVSYYKGNEDSVSFDLSTVLKGNALYMCFERICIRQLGQGLSYGEVCRIVTQAILDLLDSVRKENA